MNQATTKNPKTINLSRWGECKFNIISYAKGGTAVIITALDGEHICTLSVWVEGSENLPNNVCYIKDWSENQQIAEEAIEKGLINLRDDFPIVPSGYVNIFAYEIAPEYLSQKLRDSILVDTIFVLLRA